MIETETHIFVREERDEMVACARLEDVIPLHSYPILFSHIHKVMLTYHYPPTN